MTATYTLEAQDKDGILKEAIWLDECTAKAESSEDLRSIKKTPCRAPVYLNPDRRSRLGLVTCRCPQIRIRRSHQDASVHQTWKSRLINPSLINTVKVERVNQHQIIIIIRGRTYNN
jgi:hypothetical protein